MEQIKGISYRLQGVVGGRAERNIQNWLSTAPFADNAIFTTFQQREQRLPDSPIMGFASEFPGKLLTGIAECYRMSRGDERLLSSGNYLVKRMKQIQGDDGYLGLYCQETRYLGSPNMRTWDIWGVYHNMYGLYQWYLETDNQEALEICLKSADGMCRFFLDEDHRIEEAGCYEANGAGGRIFCLLYELTGAKKYLQMAKKFEKMWESDGCGNFLSNADNHQSFHLGEQHRWESLHALMQIADMARITGEKRYRDAFVFYWEDIQRHDIHSTGGYSSREGSCGDPFSLSAVELCCSITWAAMTVEYLKITNDSYAADELERNLYNGLLGSQNPTGRWWTYSTPTCGQKKPSVDIVIKQGFHFDGAHEINCCAANSARGIGILSSWAVMTGDNALYINYYGKGETELNLKGQLIKLHQETEYPRDGHIVLNLELESPTVITLHLRIPTWSIKTKVIVNKEEYETEAGKYFSVTREWRSGDVIELDLDMELHYWVGNERVKNCTAIYYGPVLLAYDRSDNEATNSYIIESEGDYQPSGSLFLKLDNLEFDARHMEYEPVEDLEYPQPWVKFCFKDRTGQAVYLIDFANAGMAHDYFTTWFDIKGIPNTHLDGRNCWIQRL